MTAVWFSSDLHIGHGKVSDIRGFNTPEDHDQALADNWDDAVHPDDHIWILGDLSAGGAEAEGRALFWMDSRPGHKHLILGNHDRGFPGHRGAHKYFPRYYESFESVSTGARRKIDGHQVLLSHFPYAGGGDHTEVERHTQWRLPDLGTPLLHGHTHQEGESTTWTDKGTMQISVGPDANDLTPVSVDMVRFQLNYMAPVSPELYEAFEIAARAHE